MKGFLLLKAESRYELSSSPSLDLIISGSGSPRVAELRPLEAFEFCLVRALSAVSTSMSMVSISRTGLASSR